MGLENLSLRKQKCNRNRLDYNGDDSRRLNTEKLIELSNLVKRALKFVFYDKF